MPSKISKSDERLANRLKGRIERRSKKIEQSFYAAVLLVKSELSLSDIEEKISTSQTQLIESEADHIYEEVIAALLLALLFAGKATAKDLAYDFALDVEQVKVGNFMVRESTRISSNFIKRQHEAITEALRDSLSRGESLRKQARAVKNAIGLTVNQVKAINNYRDALEAKSKKALRFGLRDKAADKEVLEAINSAGAMSRKKINALVSRYRENQIRHRAKAIAYNETSKAIHEGQHMVYEDMIANGIVTPQQVTKIWITKRDKRVRSSHSTMHGQKRTMGELFVSGNGIYLRFPHDPNAPISETSHCRCMLIMRPS